MWFHRSDQFKHGITFDIVTDRQGQVDQFGDDHPKIWLRYWHVYVRFGSEAVMKVTVKDSLPKTFRTCLEGWKKTGHSF